MSEEHKAALAEGRRQSRAIKGYLDAANTPKRRGRPLTKESIQAQLDKIESRLSDLDSQLVKLDLIQRRIDLQTQLEQLAEPVDLAALEAAFIEHAASYSKRKGISYSAWREAGVQTSVLKRAGIPRTRS